MTDPSIVAQGYDAVYDAMPADRPVRAAPPFSASRSRRLAVATGALAFFAFELHPERARGLPVIGDDPVDDYPPSSTTPA